jgi:hypothetical protein
MSRERSWDGPAYDVLADSGSFNGQRGGEPHDTVDTVDDEPDTWAPVDLAPYVDGTIVRPEPTIGLARSDGLRLLYPGKEHAVIGEMEAGKSWVAIACVAAELLAGRHAVYIHFEESDPTDTVERLRALGVPAAAIRSRLRFVGPERPVAPAALAALLNPVPRWSCWTGSTRE